MDAVKTAWLSGFTTPDRRGIAEFGRSDVDLRGDYHPQGFFHVETSRYLVLPFQLLLMNEVRMLNILKSIQTGGTLIADMFFYYCLKNAPGPFMFTLQTDDDAEQHYLTRIQPTLAASPALKPALAGLHKKRDLYQFPAMNTYFQGANMNSLQRKSVRNQANDEVWDWSPGMLAEAWGRTERFSRVCKILNISQGGEEGSDWDHAYHAGRRHEWGVHCAKCHHHQPYAFFANMLDQPSVRAGMVWDERARRPDGRWNISRAAETARWRCCKCGHEHPNEPRTWERFNANGEYLILDPDRPLKNSSVHWESIVNGNYDNLVAEFLQASEVRDQGSAVALQKFYQKKLARMWSVSLSHEKITLTTTDYAMEEPLVENYKWRPITDEAIRFLTADFQEGRDGDSRHFITVCRAWRSDGSSRLLYYGRVDSPERLHQLETALGVKPACVAVDGQYMMRTVAGWCARYGWTMLLGEPDKTFPHRAKRPGEKAPQLPYSRRYRTDPRVGRSGAGRRFAWTFRWSNPSIKPITWNLRHGLGPKWETPDDIPEPYRDGIDSEVLARQINRKTGKPENYWKQIKINNHPWDDENMQTTCALIANLIPFDLQNEPSPEKEKSKNTPPSAPHDKPQQLELIST